MPGIRSWWEGSLTVSCKAACVICHTFFSYSYLFISLFWNATSTPLRTLWVKSRDLSLTRRVTAMNYTLHPLDKSSQSLVINSRGHSMYSFWREISSLSCPTSHFYTASEWTQAEGGLYISGDLGGPGKFVHHLQHNRLRDVPFPKINLMDLPSLLITTNWHRFWHTCKVKHTSTPGDSLKSHI